MKKSFAILALLLVLAAPVSAYSPTERPAEQVGEGQVLNPTSSTALTVPQGAQWAVFSVRSAGVHVEWDGTAATTSDLYLPTGVWRTNLDPALLDDVRIIDSSDGASTVTVTYFRLR